MPRGLFTLKSTGLKEFADELERLGENFPEIIRESLIAQEQVAQDAIRSNWVTMVGGTSGGYVYNSVGQSTAFSEKSKNIVVGTVGVYHMDTVANAFDITSKDLNAAQIAYWVEFGTSRLKSGQRKVKGAEYSEEDLITVTPKPFISNAFYATLDAQEKAFSIKFNELADKLR